MVFLLALLLAIVCSLLWPAAALTNRIQTAGIGFRTSAGFNIGAAGIVVILIAPIPRGGRGAPRWTSMDVRGWLRRPRSQNGPVLHRFRAVLAGLNSRYPGGALRSGRYRCSVPRQEVRIDGQT